MIREYIIKETLGKGSYGIVYKVQKKNTNEIYVIKQITLKGLSSKEKNEVRQEAKILSSINSDFVVKYYDSFEENNNINIVMEYCDEGDLHNFILKKREENKLIEEKLIWNLFIKMTIGLAHIHKMKILHRDLKTMNIFLKSGFQVKIGDLGVAKVLLKNSFAKTLIGTPYYLSPEICQEKPYNNKSDVWALGCILYELCTFKHPFEAKSQGALILKIMSNTPDNINKYYSKELNNLIFLLLEKDSEKRPNCVEILKYDFVLDKVKSLGYLNYLKDLNDEKKNIINDNNIYKMKITTKIINVDNINNNISHNNNNQNIFQNNIIKANSTKGINKINSNYNKNNIQKRKSNEIKIKEIILGNVPGAIKNPQISYRNPNNQFLYNNFFINDEKNKYNKKLNNEFISKKNGKVSIHEKPEIISKKLGKINQFKIVLNIPDKPPKTSNNFFPKKILFFKDKNKKETVKLNKEKEGLLINNNIKIKKIKHKYKFNENEDIFDKGPLIDRKINEIFDKKTENKEEGINNIFHKFKLERKKNDIIKYNKIIPDENCKEMKEKYLIKDVPISENEKENNNFEIINNKSSNSFELKDIKENIKSDELEDSIKDNILNNNKNESDISSIKESKNNSFDIDKDLSNECDEENVKEINENKNQILKDSAKSEIINKKKVLTDEIIILENKINEIKRDILNLIGKDDYIFIMNLFENNIKYKNQGDEIYEKIENFSKKKYSPEKKEKFFYYYLLLVCNDSLIDKKNKEIQSLNF